MSSTSPWVANQPTVLSTIYQLIILGKINQPDHLLKHVWLLLGKFTDLTLDIKWGKICIRDTLKKKNLWGNRIIQWPYNLCTINFSGTKYLSLTSRSCPYSVHLKNLCKTPAQRCYLLALPQLKCSPNVTRDYSVQSGWSPWNPNGGCRRTSFP